MEHTDIRQCSSGYGRASVGQFRVTNPVQIGKKRWIILVDRETDGFQDKISPDIKKFAWNGKGNKEKLEASF